MSEPQKTVCIFEDNPDIQMLLKVFFKKRGLNPVVTGDGTDALEVVRKHAPCVILMDIIMPGKDGIEACKELRDNGLATPVVFLTSKPFPEDKERALAAGGNAFLLKPFNPRELEAALQPFLA
ncbi:MAG: response regulator [Elusimicrobia bacterium]|nr:response regulator [Elusimicrobiota bacterium]